MHSTLVFHFVLIDWFFVVNEPIDFLDNMGYITFFLQFQHQLLAARKSTDHHPSQTSAQKYYSSQLPAKKQHHHQRQ
jgi:hypothetical protein